MSNPDGTIYLVRHAAPDFDRRDLVYYLPPGPPLTPQGEQEAVELAGFLKTEGLTGLYCSPLERCLRTAQAVSVATGVPSLTEPRLAEAHPGESEADLQARVRPIWEKAVQESQTAGGAVALVTHGAPVAMLLKQLGMDRDTLSKYCQQFDHFNPLPTAGVWKAVRSAENQAWVLDLVFTPNKVLIEGGEQRIFYC